MATQIPFGKNRYLRVYKKDWLVILATVLIICGGVTIYLLYKPGGANTSEIAEVQGGDSYSASNGYFYQSLGDGRYSLKFNYPKSWGDVTFNKNLLEDISAMSSRGATDSVTGRFAYGSFTNKPAVYFVARSPRYNIAPDKIDNNPDILKAAKVSATAMKTIYEQVGAAGCIGDGQYVEDEIEQNNAKNLICPRGGEDSPTLDTIVFNMKDVTRVGYSRLLPSIETDSGMKQHIAVIDLPRSDFGNKLTDLMAVSFVNLNSVDEPDADYLRLVRDVQIL